MTKLQHKTPCAQCPFRRTSAAGWLGSASPEDFVRATITEADMPCHIAVDYDDKGWRKKLAAAPACAGSLIFLRNMCKLPRDPALAAMAREVTADHVKVFSRPDEFLAHHERDSADEDAL